MTAILDAIDDALTAYADHTGSPWPGREPTLDELLEALFGVEDGTDPTPYVPWKGHEDALRLIDMYRDCGCNDGWHEERGGPQWRVGFRPAVGGFIASDLAPSSGSPCWEPWLVEEDAWLADRATREAATR